MLFVVFTFLMVDREKYSMMKLYPVTKSKGKVKFFELADDFVILDKRNEKITILTERNLK